MKEIARFYKVLADESRLRMLWLLLNHRELCVCDFTAVLGITQSKASRHLATLRLAGLVDDRREGAWSHYSLCPGLTGQQRAQLDALRRQLADHPAAVQALADLEAHLERKGRESCAPPATGGSR